MTLITTLFFNFVTLQNICLNYYERFMNYLKDRARIFAGPPRQDYWLFNNNNNRGRVYSILFDVPNNLMIDAFQFHNETNRIHKINSTIDQYVRLPYITFEYVKGEERVDLSDWIQTLRISQNHTIDHKTLLELFCILNHRVLNYNDARVQVTTRQGAELSYELS